MPKRTRLQQDQHNQRRRELKKEAREATFCMGYILRKYPSIYNEATQLYKKLNKRYPNKRDLTKTYFAFIFNSTRIVINIHLKFKICF